MFGYYGDAAHVYRSDLAKLMRAHSEEKLWKVQVEALKISSWMWTERLEEARSCNPCDYEPTNARLALDRDDRIMPKRAWEEMNARFGKLYRWRQREEPGAGEIHPKTEREGTTVNVYMGLTGTLLCTVDVEANTERQERPTKFDRIAFEVERWADKIGKNPSEGYHMAGMRFFEYPFIPAAKEIQKNMHIRDIAKKQPEVRGYSN